MKGYFGSQGPPGWLVTGGMASVALAYVFLVFLPAQKGMKAARQKLAEKQQYILDTDRLLTTVSTVQKGHEQANTLATQWKLDAPDAHQADRLTSLISAQANLAGARILRMEPQAAKTRVFIAEYPILVSVEGSFEEIFNFFKSVEELAQAVWVQDVKLQRLGELDGDLRCDLTLTIFGDLAD